MTFDTARETSDAVNFILRKFAELRLQDPLQAQSLEHEHPKESMPTFLIAADEARDEVKNMADLVCDEVDDHDEIMAAVTALPFSGGRVLLSEGEFRPAWDEIVLNRGTHLQGMGRGATEIFMPVPTGGNEIAISSTLGGAFTTISDLDILMSNQGTSIQRGVKLIGDRATLRNVGVANSEGVGVEITSTSRDSIIEHSDISFATGDNITVAGDRAHIHHNRLEGGEGNGILLEGTVREVQIVHNLLFNQDNDGIILGVNTLYNIVQGNHLESQGLAGTPGTGIVVGGSFQQILDNLVTEAAHHGIDLTSAFDCAVIRNMIHHSSTLLSGNAFDNIHVATSDRNKISDNQLISRSAGGDTTRYGINISDAASEDNIVVDNDLGPAAAYGTDAFNDAGTRTRTTYPAHANYGDNFSLGGGLTSGRAQGHAAPSALITATVV